MKRISVKKLIFYIVSIIELILYLSFLCIDIFFNQINTTYIKYSCIILLFIFSFIYYKKWDLRHISFRFAYLFTLIADLFLLVLNNDYIIGVSFFLLAQISYFIYLNHNEDKKRIIKYLTIYFILAMPTSIIASILLQPFDILYIIVSFYFSLLIINCISCFEKRKEIGLSLFIGFFLFILCDINVGLNNLDYINSNSLLLYLVSIAMWLFYLPSQCIIVNSLDQVYKE